jgi:broad specificity phosphatase PhoE
MKRARLIRHAQSSANAGLATTAPDSIPLTEKGRTQAQALADCMTSAPDLIIASPFERAMATAQPMAERYPLVPFQLWAVEEFTYLSPCRFAATTQAERAPHVKDYWHKGHADTVDGPGAESFDHLLERAAHMLNELAQSNAMNIHVYSHGQFIRAAAWLIKHASHSRSRELMREFRAQDIATPLGNCWSYQLAFTEGRWAVQYGIDPTDQSTFTDEFCTP